MRIFIKPDVKIISYKGNGLLVNSACGKFVKLNQTGEEIVNIINKVEGIELNEIINQISKNYIIPIKLLSSEIEEYINKLIMLGFLQVDEEEGEKKKSEDELNKEVEIKYSKKEPFVLKQLWLQVTNQCNLNCPYCYARSSKKKSEIEELSINEIKSVLSEAHQLGLEKIVITGGEPLLRSDIINILEVSKQYGKVQLLTNGTINSKMEDWWAEVIKYCDIIQFSIDGSSPIDNGITRGEDSFEKTMSSIETIKKLGFKNIVFAMTPSPKNMGNIKKMAQFAMDNGARRLHVNYYIPIGRANEFSNFDLKEFYRQVDEAYSYLKGKYLEAKKQGNRLDFSIDVSGDQANGVFSKEKKYGCGIGKSLLSIDSVGKVFFCAALHDLSLMLGDIRVKNLSTILENIINDFEPLEVDNLQDCKKCEVRYFCGGGCRALANVINHNLYGLDPLCFDHKKRIFELMSRI